MARQAIAPEQLRIHAHDLWAEQNLLLTAGDFGSGRFNTMTVGWGSMGVMWGKPFVQVVVRPVRYTYVFMEEHDTFTLTAFAKEHDPALMLLGTKSGRDGDKIAEAGLTPMASTRVAAPGFEEAELILECRKLYAQDMDPACFVDPALDESYPDKDYHRIYFGEILAVHGEDRYAV
jgi:flavin reductase (DIM6/NTAB) family NADH-FMN oxidoreductase RutF